MSMKGKLGMYMAMAGLFGGFDTPYYDLQSLHRRKKEPEKPLTPEEIAEILEQRKRKFNNELLEENERLSYEFPKWKAYIVNGYTIISSNQKNAIKQFNYLMKSNLLLLEHLVVSN